MDPQPDEDLQGFLDWITVSSEHEVVHSDPYVRNPFMPIDRLTEHLQADQYESLWDILTKLYGEDLQVFPHDIVPAYTAVFCILLRIGKARYIKHFIQFNHLSDIALPFDPTSSPRNFPTSTQDGNFLASFCNEQWKFCAPILQYPLSDKYFEADRVLPIVFKEELARGVSATIWKVKVHPSYNNLIPDELKSDQGGHPPNTFVLKTYSGTDAEKLYKNEVTAFMKVGHNQDIIGFRGSFRRGETHNVLLEYADKGTLEEYFENETPPSDGHDIIMFWESLFKITAALQRIHEVGPSRPHGTQIFQGWHQDVKPANILVMGNGLEQAHKWQFKLADLGISHFKIKGPSRENSTASDTIGTRTYGAPDCYRPDQVASEGKLRVGRDIDIWSLGCIYSEAARWIAHHSKGVSDYRQERMEETSRIIGFRDADCFHNGKNVLQAVLASHKKTTRGLRKEDFITDSVIENIVHDMLLDTPKGRPSTRDLWLTQKRVVNNARERLNEYLNEGRRQPPCPRKTQPLPRPAPPVLPPHITQHSKISSIHQGFERVALTGEDMRFEDHSPESGSDLGGEIENFHQNQRQLPPLNTSPYQSPPTTSQATYTNYFPQLQHEERNSSSTENYFRGPSLHNDRPRGGADGGTSHDASPGSPTARSCISSAGIAPSMTGSLKRGPRNQDQPRHSWHINGTRRPASTAGTQEASIMSGLHREKDINTSNHHRSKSNYPEALQPLGEAARPINGQHVFPPLTDIPESQPLAIQTPDSLKVTSKDRIPEMSIQEALDWKQQKKQGYSAQLKAPNLQNRLKERDHVFLIDDSTSMGKEWPTVVRVLEALSYIVKTVDPNGIDLLFTNSDEKIRNCKKTKLLVELVCRKIPQNHSETTTEINIRLGSIVDRYIARLDETNGFFGRFSRPVRPMNLYIFTDGRWECDAEAPIRRLVNKLIKLGKNDKLQVGIQFIRFGNDHVGEQQLKHLDSGLDLPLDIVDTVPADGNVWKMLHGPINKMFDDEEESENEN